MATTKTRYARYKNRTYILAYMGPTKFGRRAKLAFLDSTKEFWVNADLVTETEAPEEEDGGDYDPDFPSRATAARSETRYASRACCKGCRGAITDAPHHRAMGGFCGNCAFDEFDM